MNEELHIDLIAEAGAAWEAAVRSYVRTWGRPAADGMVTAAEWRASEAERAARSAYEGARDEYRLHLRGDPHEEGGLSSQVDEAPSDGDSESGDEGALADAATLAYEARLRHQTDDPNDQPG
jgi:hypothetical protein